MDSLTPHLFRQTFHELVLLPRFGEVGRHGLRKVGGHGFKLRGPEEVSRKYSVAHIPQSAPRADREAMVATPFSDPRRQRAVEVVLVGVDGNIRNFFGGQRDLSLKTVRFEMDDAQDEVHGHDIILLERNDRPLVRTLLACLLQLTALGKSWAEHCGEDARREGKDFGRNQE